jgi:hypothetical protein
MESDLALYQSLPDLPRNRFQNPDEFDLALDQTLPDLTWLCTTASQIFAGTFSDTLLNLT